MSNDSFNLLNLENFYFEPEWIVSWPMLYERTYIEKVFFFLQEILGEKFSNFFFVYYASSGNSNPPQPIVLNDERPKILIWSGDQTAAVPLYMLKYFDIIFKTHLDGDRDIEKYYHLPLGYTKNLIEQPVIKKIKNRKYNIFYSGNLNQNRFKLYKDLANISFINNRLFKKVFYSRFNIVFPKTINKYEKSFIQFTDGFAKGLNAGLYSEYMYNSKITINPPGFLRNETFRHYESLKVGAIPISLPLPNNYFYRGAPFEIIQSWKELDKRVKYLLSNPSYMDDKQNSVVSWWNNKCSEKAVAAYICEIMDRNKLL